MDLYSAVVDEARLHENFKRTRNDSFKVNVINSWADETFVSRDGKSKFVKEFQTTFNSAFWELYCYQVLKQLGCSFDFSEEYPDFRVVLNGESFLVECTIANNALADPAESDIDARLSDNSDLDEMVYHQIIRLANSLGQKNTKYHNQYIKNSKNIGKPYIIAVEPFDQPYFMQTGNEAPTSLLYGEVFDRDKRDIILVDYAVKESGTPIPLGIFKTEEYRYVSGVFFSNVASIGKVDAIGNDPDLTFVHLRYDLSHKKPIIGVDSRLPDKKYDLRTKAIKENFKDSHELYDKWSVRRPLITWETKYTESLADGLYFFVNPLAINPVSENFINSLFELGVNVIKYDLINSNVLTDLVHDGSLIQRNVINLKERKWKSKFC